jgi:D-lactate dehydrogenase
MLETKYWQFYDEIIETIPKKRVFTDKLHTLAYGTDASFYRLIPKIVIKADNAFEVQTIIKLCNAYDITLTFRAAGTSLSGQAISDSVLVITSRNFTGFKIAKDKKSISLQPSLTGAQANALLAPYGKKIGPDPASINAAMIGGIAANNASGMCCGIEQNSYKTLKSMKLIFADGTKLDTACEDSKKEFKRTHAELLNALTQMAHETQNNQELKALIEKKFKIKNTCGYALNSLIDFEDPFEILQHLIIGSEGTLAFIEEITYETVDELPHKASALIYFKDVKEACNAVTAIKLAKEDKTIDVDAVELIDRAGLRSIENDASMPEFIKNLDNDVTALLIETRAASYQKLSAQIKKLETLLQKFKVVRDMYFTKDVQEYTQYWKIRKGLFPAVGAVRKIGTTVIIEDVAYPIEHLAKATVELQALFKKHAYHEALIFGHALEGNFHFVFTQDFSTASEVKRYDALMNDVVEQVAVKYKGSLKAEHGTGRNMAAFIEIEWGKASYELMQRIKKLFDPKGILNPGVIINHDTQAHLKNLKPLPATNELVDTCIECGFCEPVCPSNELTLTPRQRIVINREISRLEALNEHKEANEYKKLYVYDGLDTCATCSQCSMACPVGIDTGSLTKYLRHERNTAFQNKTANKIAAHFNPTLTGFKWALKGANAMHTLLGTSNMQRLSTGLRNISGNRLPLWSPYLPKASSFNIHKHELIASSKKVVYFPSCINRTFGQAKNAHEKEELSDITLQLLLKAGFEVIFPSNLEHLCCGMPFSSKGFFQSANTKSEELEQALLQASKQGDYPILCDMSPCTKRMLESFKTKLPVFEPIEFALTHLIAYLKIEKTNEPIVIHATCSTKKMGLEQKMIELAQLCSHEVIIPKDISCCGFAGDKGFSFPEFNESALRNLKKGIPSNVKKGFSTSKTCEIGLSQHSGVEYNSIFYLLNNISVAK